MSLRLTEALVDYLTNDLSIAAVVPENNPAGGEYHIAAWAANVPDRRPFLGVQLGRSLPLTNSSSGWIRTPVLITSYSSDEIICTKIADAVQKLFISEENPNNRDISNDYVTVANAMFRQRWGTGKTPFNFEDGTDVWVDMLEVEVIWLELPCEGDPYDLEYEVCPDSEDDRQKC